MAGAAAGTPCQRVVPAPEISSEEHTRKSAWLNERDPLRLPGLRRQDGAISCGSGLLLQQIPLLRGDDTVGGVVALSLPHLSEQGLVLGD